MEITPPSDLEICLSIDFAPLGPRDCPRASPSGNLSGLGVQNQYFGKSLGPRGRNFQYIPPLVSVILHSPITRYFAHFAQVHSS